MSRRRYRYLASVPLDAWGLFLAAGGSFTAREWAALSPEAREALAEQGRALDASRALLAARATTGGPDGLRAVAAALDGGEAADEAAVYAASGRALARHWPSVGGGT